MPFRPSRRPGLADGHEELPSRRDAEHDRRREGDPPRARAVQQQAPTYAYKQDPQPAKAAKPAAEAAKSAPEAAKPPDEAAKPPDEAAKPPDEASQSSPARTQPAPLVSRTDAAASGSHPASSRKIAAAVDHPAGHGSPGAACSHASALPRLFWSTAAVPVYAPAGAPSIRGC
ncbi:hypothetical protein POSPLADRAFT_1053906 [Postia placenta MAD-698-R-SB12]|uniref:Uncharacterized protein n=1 Tax=Postia placenta MAD-698-R-SB12 TaxID=670580 RepID=A0A1X6N9E8_9APHY|nr:hypothetical protein POSPLADRAFT_1053906 [Postia placenta MAD-698-R-SB12]OSX65132.1 hypothetical protein POSPLADRAFT_1053906 [Postia placenta MAD-698-R-SB12]